MGIQDRDWYWKDREAKARAEREANTSPPSAATNNPAPETMLRRANATQPPKLWGSDWHWSIQLLVWLCIAVLLLLAWRLVR
ncbi:hypothetical protein GmRootV116_37430 [Variovorax sp. V116]